MGKIKITNVPDADKVSKIVGVDAENKWAKIDPAKYVDTNVSKFSTRPVQNQAIAAALEKKAPNVNALLTDTAVLENLHFGMASGNGESVFPILGMQYFLPGIGDKTVEASLHLWKNDHNVPYYMGKCAVIFSADEKGGEHAALRGDTVKLEGPSYTYNPGDGNIERIATTGWVNARIADAGVSGGGGGESGNGGMRLTMNFPKNRFADDFSASEHSFIIIDYPGIENGDELYILKRTNKSPRRLKEIMAGDSRDSVAHPVVLEVVSRNIPGSYKVVKTAVLKYGMYTKIRKDVAFELPKGTELLEMLLKRYVYDISKKIPSMGDAPTKLGFGLRRAGSEEVSPFRLSLCSGYGNCHYKVRKTGMLKDYTESIKNGDIQFYEGPRLFFRSGF